MGRSLPPPIVAMVLVEDVGDLADQSLEPKN